MEPQTNPTQLSSDTKASDPIDRSQFLRSLGFDHSEAKDEMELAGRGTSEPTPDSFLDSSAPMREALILSSSFGDRLQNSSSQPLATETDAETEADFDNGLILIAGETAIDEVPGDLREPIRSDFADLAGKIPSPAFAEDSRFDVASIDDIAWASVDSKMRIEKPDAVAFEAKLDANEGEKKNDSPDAIEAEIREASAPELPENLAPPEPSNPLDELDFIDPPEEEADEPESLNLNCPACERGLTLLPQHLGIAGACVWCEAPIIAAVSGLDQSISIFQLALESEDSLATEPESLKEDGPTERDTKNEEPVSSLSAPAIPDQKTESKPETQPTSKPDPEAKSEPKPEVEAEIETEAKSEPAVSPYSVIEAPEADSEPAQSIETEEAVVSKDPPPLHEEEELPASVSQLLTEESPAPDRTEPLNMASIVSEMGGENKTFPWNPPSQLEPPVASEPAAVQPPPLEPDTDTNDEVEVEIEHPAAKKGRDESKAASALPEEAPPIETPMQVIAPKSPFSDPEDDKPTWPVSDKPEPSAQPLPNSPFPSPFDPLPEVNAAAPMSPVTADATPELQKSVSPFDPPNTPEAEAEAVSTSLPPVKNPDSSTAAPGPSPFDLPAPADPPPPSTEAFTPVSPFGSVENQPAAPESTPLAKPSPSPAQNEDSAIKTPLPWDTPANDESSEPAIENAPPLAADPNLPFPSGTSDVANSEQVEAMSPIEAQRPPLENTAEPTAAASPQKRSNFSKRKSNGGKAAIIIAVLGLISGAGIASFFLPVDTYVEKARGAWTSWFESKVGVENEWDPTAQVPMPRDESFKVEPDPFLKAHGAKP